MQRTLGGSPQGGAGGVWAGVWGGQALGVANRLLDFQRAAQHGVLARRQLLEAGLDDDDIAWDADARRDLAELAVADARSARVTYGLVFGEPCLTAGRIAQVLRRGGWVGELRRCPDCPPAYGL